MYKKYLHHFTWLNKRQFSSQPNINIYQFLHLIQETYQHFLFLSTRHITLYDFFLLLTEHYIVASCHDLQKHFDIFRSSQGAIQISTLSISSYFYLIYCTPTHKTRAQSNSLVVPIFNVCIIWSY